MSDKSWKAFERRVAYALGGRRNPLSGADKSTGTKGDCQVSDLYVECKMRGKIPFYADFRKAQELAAKEGKPLAFVIHAKGTKQNLVTMDFEDFLKILEAARKTAT